MNKTVVLKSILWLCLGIIFILPVFLIIMNAFKPNNDILTSFISFPKSLYLENFSEAMRIMNFWTVFRNTLFVTVCTVIVASAVSFMSAYGISHLPQKTGDKLYTLFVVGQIIPFHAVMIAISMLSTKLGLTNTHLGLIIFYSGFYTSFGVMTQHTAERGLFAAFCPPQSPLPAVILAEQDVQFKRGCFRTFYGRSFRRAACIQLLFQKQDQA